jgi:hypothetical protein
MIPDDELTDKLRQAARRKRPWTMGRLLLPLIVFGVPAAVLAWWVWPRAHPPEMMVIGSDQVTLPGKSFKVWAAAEPVQPSDKLWGGFDLFLEEVPPNGSDAGDVLPLRTDMHGIGQTEWKLKVPAPIAEIDVRYLDNSMRPPVFDRGRCRVFTWPASTRLLLIDIEPTLRKASDGPVVAKALAEAQKSGWQIAYLAVSAGAPRTYRELREWALRQTLLEEDPLPDGPVLSRPAWFGSESAAAASKQVLAALKAAYAGEILYITADAGLKLHTVAKGGDFTSDPIAVQDWTKLPDALKQPP